MSDATAPREGVAGSRGFHLDAWIRPLRALVVAGVAACASYVHQREFALQGGADAVSASLLPLSVDGLLLLAAAGLLKPTAPHTRRARGVVWAAFVLGIAVSPAANIAAAPALEWQPVLVAGWPAVALLLSVALLVHRPVDRLDMTAGQWGEGGRHGKSERLQEDGDPFLPRARMIAARHRELHQRPVSDGTRRRELHIGARRSRQLAALVPGAGSDSSEIETFRNRANGPKGRRSDRAPGPDGVPPGP
ncbi:DUF2637 domain-containing protein [Streptomyces sp. L7]